MKITVYIVMILMVAGCANETKVSTRQPAEQHPAATETVSSETFPPGKIIPSIRLSADSTQSFALYLPKKFHDTSRYPVIIFFDPHAEGTLPLNMYRHLADKHGFILIGSNDSKNGMDAASANKVGNNLVDEAVRRLHAKVLKVALCGFSGGAKVALAAGADNAAVSHIVYCGAAAPVRPTHHVSFLGFAGTRDMNYTDLVTFNWNLASTPYPHALIQWNGQHAFPLPTVFEDAFLFVEKGDFVHSKKKEVTITPAQVKVEQEHKQRYIEAFQNPDLTWWKKEINSLNLKKSDELMYERLLGFISLACYSISVNALQQKDLAFAEKILTIYRLADPLNKACGELEAELERKKKTS